MKYNLTTESPHTLNLEDLSYIKSLANSDDNHAKLKIKGITEKKKKKKEHISFHIMHVIEESCLELMSESSTVLIFFLHLRGGGKKYHWVWEQIGYS